jgi:hypothetical protein
VRPLNPFDTEEWWESELDVKFPLYGPSYLAPVGCDFVDLHAFDCDLTPFASMWMSNKLGEGEDTQHLRNDCLFRVVMLLAGLNSFSRDDHESSTAGNTRCDSALKYDGLPLVFIEEEEIKVHKAVEDLTSKFCWIPHYNALPFIFGIAISFTEMRVFCMNPRGEDSFTHTDRLGAPIIRIGLMDLRDRMKCIKYMVNIARVLKHFISSGAVRGSSISFDVWKHRGPKSVRLSSRYVEHQFEEKEKYQEMKNFYVKLGELRIPFVEHLYSRDPFDDTKRIIRLQPVGDSRCPKTIDELRSALRCVYRFMRQLHDAGFMHCDIRWPNIVWVWGQWFVIDCTEAIRCDAEPSKLLERPKTMKESYVFDTEKPWSPRYDYYQFGRLIQSTSVVLAADSDLAKVSSMLMNRSLPEVDITYLNSVLDA